MPEGLTTDWTWCFPDKFNTHSITHQLPHLLAAISTCKNIQVSQLQPDVQALHCWLRNHYWNAMLLIPKGAEMEINSSGAPWHYRGMSPSKEPLDTSGRKTSLLGERGRELVAAYWRQVEDTADTNCQFPRRTWATCCRLSYWHRLLSWAAGIGTIAIVRREIYMQL